MSMIHGPPISGVIGVPPAQKPFSNDFRPNTFDNAIEQKGARFIWSRGTLCPCAPINAQTNQSDPNCALCKGRGWMFFGPKDYVPTAAVGELDALQTFLLERDNGAVIRGIVTGIGTQEDPVTQIGAWVYGSSTITVRPQNKLGYYDRLIHLDSHIAFSELIDVGSEVEPLKTRFPVRAVNLLRSASTRFDEGTDFEISVGEIKWLTGKAPVAGTRVTAHYLCHPQWLVIDQPNALREETSNAKGRKKIAPVGEPVPMPVKAIVKLEFLVS